MVSARIHQQSNNGASVSFSRRSSALGLPLGSIAAFTFTNCDIGSQASAAVGAGANWTAPGGAADESSFSRLDWINLENIDRLRLE
jgi:hypothetical protein